MLPSQQQGLLGAQHQARRRQPQAVGRGAAARRARPAALRRAAPAAQKPQSALARRRGALLLRRYRDGDEDAAVRRQLEGEEGGVSALEQDLQAAAVTHQGALRVSSSSPTPPSSCE